MHGRKVVTTGTVATLAILAFIGGCGEATTGPTSVKPEDFASNLRLLSGNQQSGSVGAALSEVLTVKVVDAGGQAVAGATVLWQVRDGGGSINPAASTSSVSGLASVTWTLGTTLGANKAVAILQGSYVRDSVVFTATAGVGPASRLTLVSGNAQTGRVTSTLSQPLTVNVKDQYGYPVPRVRVTWAAGLFSGTVTAAADSTDASGNVSATWVLGTAATGQTATATVTGMAPVAFTATGTADTSRVITMTGGNAQTAAAGATLGTMLGVSVKDQFGNPIAGETVIFNDSLSAGGSVSPVSAVTNALGNASTTWTLGNRLGTQAARARVATTRLSFSATATAQFAQVYAGNYFTCGVTTGDRAFCWGFGEDGQRGMGAAKSASAPGAAVTTADTIAGPFQTWRQISAGTSYICGISIARQLYCWGRLASGPQSLVPVIPSGGPTQVQSFQSVSTSDTHSCLITTEGELACQGSGSQGQLGNGGLADQVGYALAAVGAPLTAQRWSAVVTGGAHTCAFMQFNPNTAAVAPADSASTSVPWCWGANGSGQLGRGGSLTANSTVPAPITSALAFDSTSLVAGALHTCALSRDGVAYCWGSNAFGQLGKAISAPARDSLPQIVAMPAGVTKFQKLYAGEYHTCGITDVGATYCWGRNNAGQLGNASTTTPPGGSLVSVSPPAGLIWRSLALGELHTCGVAVSPASGASGGTQASAGVVWCWGDNEYGQLGVGTTGTNGAAVGPSKVAGQP